MRETVVCICGQESVKAFRPNKDGDRLCKDCNKKLRQARYNHSNKGQVYAKQWREKHKEGTLKRVSKWNKENPERRKEIEAKYRASLKGKEANKKRAKRHYWGDPEYHRKKAVARNHGITPDFIAALPQVCQMCSTKERLTVDHMHPVSRGGQMVNGNLQMLCGPCNSWKQNRLILADGSGYLVGESYVG